MNNGGGGNWCTLILKGVEQERTVAYLGQDVFGAESCRFLLCVSAADASIQDQSHVISLNVWVTYQKRLDMSEWPLKEGAFHCYY